MSQKPNDQLLESLSALIDDEVSELELHRILKSTEENPEVLERWQRYNLIGSLLRKEEGVLLVDQNNFAAAVSARLDKESDCSTSGVVSGGVSSVQSSSDRKGMWQMLGKASIAASFAAGVVFSINMIGRQEQQQAPLAQAQPSASSAQNQPLAQTGPQTNTPATMAEAPRGFQLPTISAQTVSQSNARPAYFEDLRRPAVVQQPADDLTDAATQDMLNEMLIFHAERAGLNSGMTMMPFARVSKMQEGR